MKKAGVKREGLGLPAPWGERLAEALAIAEGRHGRPPRDRRAEQARAAQAAEKPPPVAPPETSVRPPSVEPKECRCTFCAPSRRPTGGNTYKPARATRRSHSAAGNAAATGRSGVAQYASTTEVPLPA